MLSNRPSALRAALAIALAVALCGAGLWVSWRVSTSEWTDSSLSALIPPEHPDPAAERALASFTRRLERQVVLVVRHTDRDAAVRAADQVSAELSKWHSLARVSGRISPEQQAAWVTFYAPYRQQLLSTEARRLLEQHQGETWRKQALALAYSPFAGVNGAELAADPFLLQRHFLLERAAIAGPVQSSDGWQLRQDPGGAWHVLITGELAIDPYGIGIAEEWTAQVNALEAKVRAELPGASLLRQGAVFYSAAGSRQAQFEVSTIGIGSMIGVMLLNILVFRHWVPFGLTLVSVAGGMIAAIAATLWLTGPLHVFTLVFGSTLIGVTEDYSCHFLCHQLDSRAQGGQGSTLQRIFPAMAMSLGTTLLAYAALLLAPFPVLRQLTVFSITGIGTSFLMVILWFPFLTRHLPPRPLSGGGTASVWLAAWDRVPSAKRWWPVLVVALAAIPFAIALKANDDVHQLQSLDAGLQRQEASIAALFGTDSSAALLLVRGATSEALLQRMEAATTRLDMAIPPGDLNRYVAVSAFIPSVKRQQEDFTLAREQLLRPLATQQATALGLGTNTSARLLREPFRPLTIEAWLHNPVSEGLRLLWQPIGADGVFAAVPLRGVQNSEALRTRMAGLEGVTYINKADEVSSHFQVYRQRITLMLILAALVTYSALTLRYGWRTALRVQAPCTIAALCALAVLRFAGLPFNLFTVLALLLVLGMGIDYTLFFVESHRDAETTLLSVTIAAATTILSFGLLAFSSTAAIANFGVVVFTGVLISFLLAPLAMRKET